MSRRKALPDDVKKICLALVQGYEQRSKRACASLELQRVKAVRYAAGNVGRDLAESDRQILLQAIMSSCKEGRKNPLKSWV